MIFVKNRIGEMYFIMDRSDPLQFTERMKSTFILFSISEDASDICRFPNRK